MSRKATLESELADLAGKLARAERLVSGLAGERARWQGAIAALEARAAALPGDAAVAAAFLSYAGPFASEYREELVRATWLPQVGTGRGRGGRGWGIDGCVGCCDGGTLC
jgi:dynein heavy chain